MAQEKDVARLVLELSADVSKLDRGMRQGQRITENRTKAIEKSFEQMNKRTTRSVQDMGVGIRSALGGLALAAAAREVQQYADTWTRSTNALRAGGASVEQAGEKMDQLTAIALRSRSSLEGTVTLYNRLIASSGQLGVSQDRVARVVETVNKALATSNLSGGERASAVTQLAQGLGSGTLAGDELKAIRENSQVLSQAIADEFGVSIGELKKLGEEGKLTSAKVFQALESATGGVEAAFAKTRATIDDSFTNLQTKTIQFVGQLDASTGASQKLASVIEFVANHLDDIALAAGVAAVAVGTGYATAMTIATARTIAATVSSVAYQVALLKLQARQTGATVGQVALNAAMTANPIGLVVVAVAALAAGLVFLNARYSQAAVAARELNDVADQADDVLGRYEKAQYDAEHATKQNAAAAREHAAALREEANELVKVARLNSTKRLAEASAAVTAATGAANSAAIAANGVNRGGRFSADIAQARNAEAVTRIKEQTEAQKRYGEALRQQLDIERQIANVGNNLPRNGPDGGTTRPAGGGGGGGGSTARAVQGEADKVDELRRQISDIQNDLLTDTEKAAKDLAEKTAQIRAAVARGYITKAEGGQLEAGIAGQDLQPATIPDLGELGSEATDIGKTIADGFASRQQAFDEKGAAMANTFVNILYADNPGEALGRAFRDAAFNNLEKAFSAIFSQLLSGTPGAQGSGFAGTAASVIGSFFGGGRALGGPVKAGMTYRINENTPRSEYFTPSQDGYVGNMPQAKAQRTPQNVTIRQGDLYLAGANGDAVIYGNVRRMMEQNRRQTLADVKAGAPAAQLEQQLLKS